MTNQPQDKSDRTSGDDRILYSKTSDDEAGSGPGTMGSNADEDLQGNDSPVEKARKAAYPQDGPEPDSD